MSPREEARVGATDDIAQPFGGFHVVEDNKFASALRWPKNVRRVDDSAIGQSHGPPFGQFVRDGAIGDTECGKAVA